MNWWDKVTKWLERRLEMFSGKSSFFKDGTKESMMRYLALATARFGYAYGFTALIYQGKITDNDVWVILGCISAAITGKAYQKGKELSNGNTKKNTVDTTTDGGGDMPPGV